MKHISLDSVPGGKPEHEEKPPKRWLVEEECWWAPGMRMTFSEPDKTTKLDGKTCSCGEILEYRLTHELERYREFPLIPGPGSHSHPIYKRVYKVICPKCSSLYDLALYEEWRKEKCPRPPGAINMETLKERFIRQRGIPTPGFPPGRRHDDNDTRYR